MKAALATLVAILSAGVCFARLVPLWTHEKLMAESDFVAEVRFSEIRVCGDALQGHGDPNKFVAYRAMVESEKASKVSHDEPSRELVFFTYAPSGMIESNGASFLSPGLLADGVWVVYLKRSAPGLYVPTTGHYDASIAIRKIEKAAEPGATDNPDDAQRVREDH